MIWLSLLDEKIDICSTRASKTNLLTCYMLFYSKQLVWTNIVALKEDMGRTDDRFMAAEKSHT